MAPATAGGPAAGVERAAASPDAMTTTRRRLARARDVIKRRYTRRRVALVAFINVSRSAARGGHRREDPARRAPRVGLEPPRRVRTER